MVAVGVSREHELASGVCESAASFFVLKAVVSSFKENLLGCHIDAVEDGGEDAVLCVETLILPVELFFNYDFRGRKSAARARAAVAAGGARRAGRATTSVAAAWAAVGAQLVVASVRCENRGSGMPSARVLEEHVLHLLESERMAVVNVGDELFVNPLVAGSFRKLQRTF
jgi:hypothetical protein